MIQKLMNWIMHTRLYRYLLKHVIPYIRFTTYYAPLRGNKYHEGYAILQPGDTILSDDKQKLTSILIKGRWSHAARCVDKGPDAEYEIAEMTHSDFTKSWFFDICKESSRVRIKRNPNWSHGYNIQVCDMTKSFEAIKYDGLYTDGNADFSCTELVKAGDFKNTTVFTPEYIRLIGRSYITPDSIDKSPDLITVWDSHEIN